MSEAEQIILRLGLQPLQPEGGYFKRTWTGRGTEGTAIYFLLTSNTFSAFHRLKADEIWHHYAGDSVEHWQLRADSYPFRRQLGGGVLATEPEEPQLVVPALTWQGARLASRTHAQRGWGLLGCTLCPGWRDEDFELGQRSELCIAFPEHASLILSLTR